MYYKGDERMTTSGSVIFDLIDKCVTEKIYKKARKKEEKLSPDNFTAYYSFGSILYWLVIFLLLAVTAVCFAFFEKAVLYILGSGAMVCFFILLYHITYRCTVNDIGITAKSFWIFKKQIYWKDVKKVEVTEFELKYSPLEKNVIIRNKKNKIIFTCSYDLVGFNLIAKKAKKERKKKY